MLSGNTACHRQWADSMAMDMCVFPCCRPSDTGANVGGPSGTSRRFLHGAGLQTLLAAAAAGSWLAAQGSHVSSGGRGRWGFGGSSRPSTWSLGALNPIAGLGSGSRWQPRSWGFGHPGSAGGASTGGALHGVTRWHYAMAAVALPIAWLALCRSASLRLLTACAGDCMQLLSHSRQDVWPSMTCMSSAQWSRTCVAAFALQLHCLRLHTAWHVCSCAAPAVSAFAPAAAPEYVWGQHATHLTNAMQHAILCTRTKLLLIKPRCPECVSHTGVLATVEAANQLYRGTPVEAAAMPASVLLWLASALLAAAGLASMVCF